MGAGVLGVLGCPEKSPAPVAIADAGAAAPPPARADAGVVVAYPAARCADCHEPLYDEWATSAHARSDASPIYRAMRAQARGSCDACHAPLRGRLAPDSTVVGEGVTCEVCHSIARVQEGATAATMELDVGFTKRGPLCDAKPHYFHAMGCSPLHAESRVCAGCHLYYRPIEGGAPLPVFTELAEWRESAGKLGISCQDCHMPGTSREVARGSAPRPNVPHHGFMGSEDLRAKALALAASVSSSGSALRVVATVRTQGAGHRVPTGLPGRQVVLRVVAVDGSGRELDRGERTYARVLVDALGAEVPFDAARAVASDTRLLPDASREESFSFEAPSRGEVRVGLWYRPLSPGLAAAIGVPVPPEVLLSSVRVPFGPPGARGRLLPASTVTPRP